MDKYTHRMRIGKLQLEYRYQFTPKMIEKYHKDGYLYGYLADGVLVGDVIELDDDYVHFEFWIGARGRDIERMV